MSEDAREDVIWGVLQILDLNLEERASRYRLLLEAESAEELPELSSGAICSLWTEILAYLLLRELSEYSEVPEFSALRMELPVLII